MNPFQGLSRSELELTIICAASTDTESAILLEDLREDDFCHSAARHAYRAIRAIYKRHEHVNEVLVHRQLVEAGHVGSANALLDHIAAHPGDCIPVGTLRHYCAHLVDASTRDRVAQAGQTIAQMARDAEQSLEALHEAAPMALSSALARSIPCEATSARDVMLELAAQAWEREQQGVVEEPLLPLGLAALDEHRLGGAPGEMIVVGAGTSMGKSAFALQVSRSWAADTGEIYYWSGEMPRAQLGMRLACQVAQLPKRALRSSDLSGVAANLIDRLYLDDEKAINIDRLLQKVLLHKLLRPNLRGLVIDYLGLLCDNDYKSMSRASRLCKAAAGKLGIPIMVLCQLKRFGDRPDKTPQLDDLKESGQIENDADKILMLHRPGYYDPQRDQSEALCIIRKFRDGERNIAVRLKFNGSTFSFFPPSPERRPAPEMREPGWDSGIEWDEVGL